MFPPLLLATLPYKVIVKFLFLSLHFSGDWCHRWHWKGICQGTRSSGSQPGTHLEDEGEADCRHQ